MIGIKPAQGAADSSMLSAMRLVAERHGDRVRKNRAEMIVPPLASAIHQTYSAIAKPQATGILMPQTPTPFANSQDTAISNMQNRMDPKLNPIHHHSGAFGLRTGLLTSVLSEYRLTPGLMIGGLPGG